MSLDKRAMLVSLSISQWTARKFDRKVTNETNQRYAADADAGRWTKALVAKEAIAKIAAKSGALRLLFLKYSLPWTDEGSRVITVDVYQQFMKKVREIHGEWEPLVNEFCMNYPTLIEEAKKTLNGMFNPEDYPTPDRIRSKFRFSCRVLPIPTAEDFRVEKGDLSQEDIDAIKREVTETSASVVTEATKELWDRLRARVKHAAETLSDKDANRWHGTLITNMKEDAEIAKKLNIANDPLLNQIAQEVLDQLADLDPDVLKKHPRVRSKAAQDAQAILNKMSAYCGGPASK